MKKRISSIRKIFVTVLAAALISGMALPAAAFAQEAETMEDPVDTSDPIYAQLEQFLTLIADRFQIYTVAVVELTDPADPSDPSAWQPAVPEEPVEASLAIPEGYDPSRTVVAEIGDPGRL